MQAHYVEDRARMHHESVPADSKKKGNMSRMEYLFWPQSMSSELWATGICGRL